MQQVLSATQEAEAQHLAQAISQAAHDDLLQIARTLVASSDHSLFEPTEFAIHDLLLRLGAKAYQEYLAQKNGYDRSSVTCPDCDQAAAYHNDRSRSLVSLFGVVRYRRAYYYCRRCKPAT